MEERERERECLLICRDTVCDDHPMVQIDLHRQPMAICIFLSPSLYNNYYHIMIINIMLYLLYYRNTLVCVVTTVTC